MTEHLRQEKIAIKVHAVDDAHHLVSLIDRLPQGNRALVVLDTRVKHAREGYDALRGLHLRAIPVLAICALEDSEPAYGRGVNAVLPREHWEKYFSRTAARLTSFWIQLVQVPGRQA